MKILHKLNYALIQKIRGENVFHALNQMEDSQWYRQDKIKSIQWQQIKKIIAHAYNNVPFYTQSLNQARIKPEDINQWSDLLHVPILTKNDLRYNAHLLKATDKRYHYSKYSSSGSTGSSSIVLVDRNAATYRHAAVFRTQKWMGVDIADKMVTFWGTQLDRKSRIKDNIKDFFLHRKTFSTHALNADTFLSFYKIIQRFKPKIIYGFTSAIYEFAQFLQSKGLPMHKSGIGAVLVTGESLFSYQREVIGETLNCHVYVQYGAEEFGPLAYECPEGGLHIIAENVYIEVEKQNENDGKGNLIITGLKNYVMPLIRYRLGDVGIFSNAECRCGRGLPIIGEISGRSVDFVRTSDGRIIHGIYFDYLPKYFLGEILQFQVVQEDINTVCVNIVKDIEFNQHTLKKFENKLKDVLGDGINIIFDFIDCIPRESTGKFRFVVSKLNRLDDKDIPYER
jgi:phenylacetate-CoA ligase